MSGSGSADRDLLSESVSSGCAGTALNCFINSDSTITLKQNHNPYSDLLYVCVCVSLEVSLRGQMKCLVFTSDMHWICLVRTIPYPEYQCINHTCQQISMIIATILLLQDISCLALMKVKKLHKKMFFRSALA